MMRGLRILITNRSLAVRGGSEAYVRDLATGLLERGHTPIAYSTRLGDMARDLRVATVPVVDDLDALGAPPDLIHGQHHLETMTALLRFPGAPAVYFCHGWLPWEEIPPRFPRILRYVAVDQTCRDRLLFEHAVPEDRIRVLLNAVDLGRCAPRGTLPAQPRRALVLSNNASERTHLAAVRQACAAAGIEVDVVGHQAGRPTARPEEALRGADLVFAKGRSALEALAVGAAVILCDAGGCGPMVTTANLDRLRPLNFGIRTLRDAVDPAALASRIAEYDAADAAEVSRRIRAAAGRDALVDEIVDLYREVLREHQAAAPPELRAEMRAVSDYLRFLSAPLEEHVRRELARATRDLSRRPRLRDRLLRLVHPRRPVT